MRDLIEIASREPRKTRIIGLANLNQDSFARYSKLAISAGLLQTTNGRFSVTPRAKEWLKAADAVLRKGVEVSSALAALTRISRRAPGDETVRPTDRGELARQMVSRLAWSELTGPDRELPRELVPEIVLAPGGTGGPANGRRWPEVPASRPSSTIPRWRSR